MFHIISIVSYFASSQKLEGELPPCKKNFFNFFYLEALKNYEFQKKKKGNYANCSLSIFSYDVTLETSHNCTGLLPNKKCQIILTSDHSEIKFAGWIHFETTNPLATSIL